MKTSRRLAFLVALLLPATSLAQFTFTTNNGAITITAYTGTSAAVVIPDTTNGYPIVSVGTNAFYDNTIVTNVVIGDNVASLAQGAFEF
ncbi:MAG TPA: hypothetical protein VMF08_07785 [Candidatus Sulfotelmatobacter sp.]|nr:hypothetical protein [Candidatus Sulfotelmatobacter sp.]